MLIWPLGPYLPWYSFSPSPVALVNHHHPLPGLVQCLLTNLFASTLPLPTLPSVLTNHSSWSFKMTLILCLQPHLLKLPAGTLCFSRYELLALLLS